MEKDMSSSDRLEPVVKVMTVPGSPTVVFELFTDRMAEWWPLDSHSIGEHDAVGVRVEPGVGGRVIETTRDGAEHEWATIKGWAPGERLEMDWYPGIPVSQATHLEITFRQSADGTELTLVHDGWEARGADAVRMRDGYETGWDLVLGRIPGAIARADVIA
jgi:hypothetical protein